MARRREPNRALLALRIGLALCFALLATAGLALAASPQLRQQLGVLSGIGGSGDRITSLQPAPPFTIFQPSTLPGGVQLVARAYDPNAGSAGSTRLPVPMMVSAGAGGRIDPSVREAAATEAERLRGDGDRPTLVLVYATGQNQLLAVVEQPANGRPLPTGKAARVRSSPAIEQQDGAETVLTWVAQGTWLEMHSAAGADAAMQLADLLQPSVLSAANATPAAEAAPAATRVPLAERIVRLTIPSVPDAALAAQCGAWQPEPGGRLSYSASRQATCRARRVAGVDDAGSSGISLIDWAALAPQLGAYAPSGASAPTGNPLVLTVDLGDAHGHVQWEVVLDKASGHPYALLQMRP